MFAIPFLNIDPVIVQIGPIAIHWYSLAYIAGIAIGAFLISRMNRYYSPAVISNSGLEDMMVWAVVGIIVGGRLGYVLFYGIEQAIENPLWIVQTWKGGMSFHGGALGLAAAVWGYCRRNKVNFMQVADLIACVAPIGLFLGRIANFINGELYGVVTDVPWAMVFPDAGPYPRHPSQLYEAGLEGLFLGFAMFNLFYHTKLRSQPGRLMGVFLLGYAIVRILVEKYRQPTEIIGLVTMGQLLSIPMLLLGAYLLLRRVGADKKP